MRPRRALTIKSSEKTSEFRFQDFQQARQYSYIPLSQYIPVIQLVPEVFEEFSFLSKNLAVVFQQTSEHSYIHLSQSIRVSQLAPIDFKKFSFLSRNPAVEADENSEILFQFLEVDLEPVSLILEGSTYHSQSHPSRKRAALSRSLSKVVRVSFYDNYINVYLLHIKSVSLIPLLTNEDDRCQQKETAAPFILVRTERESTACFGQTSAVDAQVSTITLMRLEDKAVHTKYKQFEVQSYLSDQWT
ncbi:Hypothetical_protein [Hexamita inflata]|uniref:Hypothetical_protein n=1 Tax=Hexamita inflata TaxID=28002 RepID=A0ABP1KHF0_9EUKA